MANAFRSILLTGAVLAAGAIHSKSAEAKSSAHPQPFSVAACQDAPYSSRPGLSPNTWIIECHTKVDTYVAWQIGYYGQRQANKFSTIFDARSGLKQLVMTMPTGEIVVGASRADKAGGAPILNWSIVAADAKTNRAQIVRRAEAIAETTREELQGDLNISLNGTYQMGRVAVIHTPTRVTHFPGKSFGSQVEAPSQAPITSDNTAQLNAAPHTPDLTVGKQVWPATPMTSAAAPLSEVVVMRVAAHPEDITSLWLDGSMGLKYPLDGYPLTDAPKTPLLGMNSLLVGFGLAAALIFAVVRKRRPKMSRSVSVPLAAETKAEPIIASPAAAEQSKILRAWKTWADEEIKFVSAPHVSLEDMKKKLCAMGDNPTPEQWSGFCLSFGRKLQMSSHGDEQCRNFGNQLIRSLGIFKASPTPMQMGAGTNYKVWFRIEALRPQTYQFAEKPVL